ncbi:MAG: DUF4926 domain-containing protein [Leptolyngbyaceae cyanobacterium RU_5_1]|nr:DUF4926 domain-containing protein [Leptolyngbyaceae cyanobacterium RU_5_1]
MMWCMRTLTVNLPQYNLWRGQVGTIVETLANGTAFEVEFSDRNGRTYESLGLRPEQIMVLRFEPAAPDAKAEMVTAGRQPNNTKDWDLAAPNSS